MELSFTLSLILLLGISYSPILFPHTVPFAKGPYEALLLPEPPWTKQGESIWVLGEESSYYQNNKLATPFLNWRLTEQYLESIDSYEVVSDLQRYLTESSPTYIIDKANKTNDLFELLPLLKLQYEADPDKPFIYRRKRPLDVIVQ